MPATKKELSLTPECRKKVAELREKYPDLMALKDKQFRKVFAAALWSFVTEDNPIEKRKGIYDVLGNPIVEFKRVIPWVNTHRKV